MFARKYLALAVGLGLAACGPKVSSLEAQPKTVTLVKKGEGAQLKVVAKDAEGKDLENVPLTYTSSAPEIVTVDATGGLMPVKSGDATVKVAFGEKVAIDVPVKVSLPATLSIAPAAVKLTVGENATVIARVLDEKGREVVGAPVTWQVEDPALATADKGVLTAVAAGATKAFAVHGALKSAVGVEITEPVAAIEVKALNLKKGADAKLEPVAKDAKGNTIANAAFTFVIADPAIATVDANGAVKGLAKGKTKVTITVGGKTATTDVAVK